MERGPAARVITPLSGEVDAATWLWRELGIDKPERVPELDVDAVRALRVVA